MDTPTHTTFLQRLRASLLLDDGTIEAARAATHGDETALARYLVQQGLLTSFQARQLMAGATGFRVDKYVVLDVIGRGGNGIVFKAQHSLMGNRLVALKTLDSRDLHRGDDALPRFRREIDIVTRLDHPNVVRALDVVDARNQLYLVLEYIEGRDLASLVKERGPLPIPEGVDYAVQAARGLAYAHRNGVVHRDIKPANLLLTADGIVKLTDLGLARSSDTQPDADLTLKGVCLGTPEFMAPEQAEDASRADTRSDLYSLGATLFHLLTAQLPVSGSSYLHCLQKLLTVPPRPLREVRPEVPRDLAEIVDRLRARNPADRPQTADQVIALLEPYAHEDPHAWDPRRKAELVLELLQGKCTPADVRDRWGLGPDELQRWQECFLAGAEQAMAGLRKPSGIRPALGAAARPATCGVA
jgi:serine/threonine protein kinase